MIDRHARVLSRENIALHELYRPTTFALLFPLIDRHTEEIGAS